MKQIKIFINRVFRAIKIDAELYEEVENDKGATFQAGLVVVISSLAAGVGALHLGASNFDKLVRLGLYNLFCRCKTIT